MLSAAALSWPASASLCCWAAARRFLAAAAASSSSGGGSSSRGATATTTTTTKPRPPAKTRPDNAPLYEQMRRERRGSTERLAVEKQRSALRWHQFESAAAGHGQGRLQAAKQKPAELPPNCLAWRDYALFVEPPALKPLSADEAEADAGVSFASLLRRSAFVGLGDFEGRVVEGRVFERYEGSLYVDFGGKFHAVCPAPRVNNEKYVRGARVLLRLLDPEMTSRFLGSERHVTLAEADAVLLGLRPAVEGDGEGEGAPASEDTEVVDEEDGDTASPLRLSVLHLALAEAEAAVAAASFDGGPDGGFGVD